MRHLVFLPWLWLAVTVTARLVRTEQHEQLRRQVEAPVPPLEWIDLSSQTSGPAPPQLRDALLGFDATSNRLLVFGGKSPGGSYSGITYILNLDTLTWSNPTPTNPLLADQPPGRALAVGGPDRAASYRNDFLMFGGEGSSGPLNDIWLYNWNEQFWYQVPDVQNAPPARRGAAGGTDPLTPMPADLTTTLWVAGGSNDNTNFPLSDVWKLTIGGVLAVNTQAVTASWQKLSTQHQDTLIGQATTVMPGGRLVTVDGCAPGASTYDASCAIQSALSLATNPLASSWSRAGTCPAARFSTSIAPNLCTTITTFASQVFMLFGAVDRTLWSGDDTVGEVAVLDVDQGTWTLVLPSGKSYPKSRNGAAIVSHNSVKIGGTVSDNTADTIVFGGVDEQGNFLNDLWILRAHDGVVQSSSPTLGNVTVKYLQSCATAIAPTSSTSVPGSPSSPTSPGLPSETSPSPVSSTSSYITSVVHKSLSSVSVALLVSSIAAYRFLTAPSNTSNAPDKRLGILYLSWTLGIIAYVVGVVGFIIAFTSSKRSDASSTLIRRGLTQERFLATGHAKAGFVIFLGLYALLPLVIVLSYVVFHSRWDSTGGSTASEKSRANQLDKSTDSTSPHPNASPGPLGPGSAAASTATAGSMMQRLLGGRWKRQRVLSESEMSSPATSEPPVRSFEVVRNHRRSDSGGRGPDQSYNSHSRQNPSLSRILNDMNWIDRRRSISAVGELDYALSRMTPEPFPTTTEPPPTPHPRYDHPPTYPSLPVAAVHIVFHAFLLAACVFTLTALHSRAPLAAFVVFLLWTIACYVAIFAAAWRGLPRESILAVTFHRLRGTHEVSSLDRPGATPLQGHQHASSTSSSRGPYVHHQPAYRLAPSHNDDEDVSRRGTTPFPRSSGSDDSDVDDDERQARLEHEMERRNVTIVSVPKPKLFVTNS